MVIMFGWQDAAKFFECIKCLPNQHPETVFVFEATCGSMLQQAYVSCDPATLARDLKVLSEQGYEVEKVCAVDQFSHSSHVETVVGLQRKDT